MIRGQPADVLPKLFKVHDVDVYALKVYNRDKFYYFQIKVFTIVKSERCMISLQFNDWKDRH